MVMVPPPPVVGWFVFGLSWWMLTKVLASVGEGKRHLMECVTWLPLKALQDQGIPTQIANQFMQTTGNVRFETGNGHVNSDTSITANGNLFGHASSCMMNSCPVVRSLGQIVATGKPFVWLPDQMPLFGCDEGAIQLSADMEREIFADKVDDHVPIFTEVMQFDSTSTFGLPAAEGESAPADSQPLPAPAPAGSSAEDAGEPLSEDGDEDPKDAKDCTSQRTPPVKFATEVGCIVTVEELIQGDMILWTQEACLKKQLHLEKGSLVTSSLFPKPGPKVGTMLFLSFVMSSVATSELFLAVQRVVKQAFIVFS